MHSGKKYTVKEFIYWTRRDIYKLLLLSIIPTVLYFFGWKFIALTWVPIALLGTAVAFIVGFKNNASYARLWEARQIYGAIINASRSYGVMVRDFLGNPIETKYLFNLHFAWLTALRYQLREPRTWETMSENYNQEYQRNYHIAERETPLETELAKYLLAPDLPYLLGKKNRATQAMALASAHINQLHQQNLLDNFKLMQLQAAITQFYDNQGKAERIKNFPYPRHFSSIATILLYLFVLLVPFGLLSEFGKVGTGTFMEGHTIWFNIPFATLLTWVFVSLDRVGESSMNPFEGSANDVPITQISRTIEIDMRDMLDEKDLPPAIVAEHFIVL